MGVKGVHLNTDALSTATATKLKANVKHLGHDLVDILDDEIVIEGEQPVRQLPKSDSPIPSDRGSAPSTQAPAADIVAGESRPTTSSGEGRV